MNRGSSFGVYGTSPVPLMRIVQFVGVAISYKFRMLSDVKNERRDAFEQFGIRPEDFQSMIDIPIPGITFHQYQAGGFAVPLKTHPDHAGRPHGKPTNHRIRPISLYFSSIASGEQRIAPNSSSQTVEMNPLSSG